ncbi:MAG TPA: hypothetical protein VKS60_00245 [Stellaceae bacterium]|nr:hypothetical protein [Stellaceae bacterium]
MTAPVTVTIGGEAIALPAVLNFAGLERAWPAIEALGAAATVFDRVGAALRIVAAASGRPDLLEEAVKERLVLPEVAPLLDAIPAAFAAWGLVPAGEAQPGEAGAASGSTATSAGSSPS